MIISVASGKGGTGKTSIVGFLAALAKNKVLVDCDVDAADLHLRLCPVTRENLVFLADKSPVSNRIIARNKARARKSA